MIVLFLLNYKNKQTPEYAPAEEQVESIIKSVRECIDKHEPEKVKPVSESTNDWITYKFKNAITRRNTLFEKWINNPSTENQEKYKTIGNKVSALIREAKKEVNYRKIGKDPSARCIYRTLKAINCNQESSPPVIDPDIMLEFFVSIGLMLSSMLPVVDIYINITRVSKTMFLQPTDHWEVAKTLKQMKNKKSYSLDGINIEILKCCSPVIEPAKAAAFSKCIEERTFPKCLKIPKVIPVFKKGDKRKPENYQPISLLSPISKVLEQLLQPRMIKFCEKNSIISGNQYGFRSKRSCIDAIVSITEFIRTEIDRKFLGQACIIDLQKAFDTLDHNILLEKMEKYGYRGPIHDMMKSYLSDRWQYVDMNGEETNQKRITTGVPQGSILGSFIFLLYINNLDTSSRNSKVSMFADDTTIFNAKKNVSFTMQPETDLISDWMTNNKLTINTNKCEVMCFGSGNPAPLKIKDTPIQCKINCKYLGLHVDKWL